MLYINGYTYRAAYHCPGCTTTDLTLKVLVHDDNHVCAHPPGFDSRRLPNNMVDKEGNLAKPVYDTDETAYSAVCDTCHARLLDLAVSAAYEAEKPFLQRQSEDKALRMQMSNPFNGKFV